MKPLSPLQLPPTTTLPDPSEWALILDIAKTLIKGDIDADGINSPEAAAAVILKGVELGIPAMQSFSHIHIIQKRAACSAELQLALLARGGVTWEWIADGTGGRAEIKFYRPGFPPCCASFTTEQAALAQLTKNSSWQKYPEAMLRARTISIGARMIGPDLLGGMSHTAEEIGSPVDQNGEPQRYHAAALPLSELADTAEEIGSPVDQIGEPQPLSELANTAEEIGVHEEELTPPPPTRDDGAGKYYQYLNWCKRAKAKLGAENYYGILKTTSDIAHANELERDDVDAQKVLMVNLQAAI